MDLSAIASALRSTAPPTARLLAAYELATGDGSVEAAAALGVSRSAYYRNCSAASALVAAAQGAAAAPASARLRLVPNQSHQWDSAVPLVGLAVGSAPPAPEFPTGYPQAPRTYSQGYPQGYAQADPHRTPSSNGVVAVLAPENGTYPQDRRRRRITRGKKGAAKKAITCRPSGPSPLAASFSSCPSPDASGLARQLREDWNSACVEAGRRVPLCLTDGDAADGLREAATTYGAATVRSVVAHALELALAGRIPHAFYARIFVGGGWAARYSAYLGDRAQLPLTIDDVQRDILAALEE